VPFKITFTNGRGSFVFASKTLPEIIVCPVTIAAIQLNKQSNWYFRN
jgi:hypothetical protein